MNRGLRLILMASAAACWSASMLACSGPSHPPFADDHLNWIQRLPSAQSMNVLAISRAFDGGFALAGYEEATYDWWPAMDVLAANGSEKILRLDSQGPFVAVKDLPDGTLLAVTLDTMFRFTRDLTIAGSVPFPTASMSDYACSGAAINDSGIAILHTIDPQVRLTRYNADGGIIWEQPYRDERACVTLMADGGVTLTGFCEGCDTVSLTQFDPAGAVIRQVPFSLTGCHGCQSLRSAAGPTGEVFTLFNESAFGYDTTQVVAKFDVGGKVAWEQTLPVHRWAEAIAALPDGSVVVGGKAWGERVGQEAYAWIFILDADNKDSCDRSFGGPDLDFVTGIIGDDSDRIVVSTKNMWEEDGPWQHNLFEFNRSKACR